MDPVIPSGGALGIGPDNAAMHSGSIFSASTSRTPARLFGLLFFFLAGPAHAFITISTTGLMLILLMFAWPFVLPVMVVVLVLQWRRRAAHPKRLIVTAAVFLTGTLVWLSAMVPIWMDSLSRSRIEDAWGAIDVAVAERQYETAVKLISEHPDGDAHAYLARQIDQLEGVPDVEFAKMLFGRCVSLPGQEARDPWGNLLTQAIAKGRHELVDAWLQSKPCPPADGGSRERDLLDNVYWLLPSAPSDSDPPELGVRQANTLKALVLRYPSLLLRLPNDECMSKVRRSEPCSMVAMAFAEKHLPVVQALVSLDDRLEEHLPPVIAHVLRNDVLRAREAARQDPATVHHWLPALFATAPQQALRAALEAAPVDELALLDGNERNTQFQLLHPIVQAAESRDRDQPTWDYLNLLMDQFPTHLAKWEVNLVDYYGKGQTVKQPQGHALMKRLRAAGMDCQALRGMVSWGSAEREEGTQAMAWVGCQPPADWRPYEPSPPR
jgi:hypothetical protein